MKKYKNIILIIYLNNTNIEKNIKAESTNLIEYKESVIKKIINKILYIKNRQEKLCKFKKSYDYPQKCIVEYDKIRDEHHLTEESFLVIDYQNKIDEEFMKDIKELKLLCEKSISDNKNIICIGD